MKVICCNQCFDRIARINPNSARIWIDLCAYYANHGILGLREWRIPDAIGPLRALETSGFIETLDGADSVSVKVNGLETFLVRGHFEPLQTFCIDRRSHGNEW